MKLITNLITVFGLTALLGMLLVVFASIFRVSNTDMILLYGFVIMGGSLIFCFILYILMILGARRFLKEFVSTFNPVDKASFSIPDFYHNYGKIDFKNISNLVSIDSDIFMFTNSYWIQTRRGPRHVFQKQNNICLLIQNISSDSTIFICKKSPALNILSRVVMPIMFGRDSKANYGDFFYFRSEMDSSRLTDRLQSPLFQIKKLYENKMGSAIDTIPTPFDIRITDKNVLFRTNYDNAFLLPQLVNIMREVKNSLK